VWEEWGGDINLYLTITTGIHIIDRRIRYLHRGVKIEYSWRN